MCVIAAIPGKRTVSETQLANACENNPDGFGWAVLVRRREIVTGWSLRADVAIDQFLSLRGAHANQPAIFHARIATHGDVRLENCHPFPVGGDERIMLAHNGILPCEPGPFDDRSDTRVLCDDIIPRAGVDTLWTAAPTWERWIGNGNKLAILSALPGRRHLVIIGESRGDWDHGVWWSNTSYKWARYSYPTYSGTTTVYRTGADGKLEKVVTSGPSSKVGNNDPKTDDRRAEDEFPHLTATARGTSLPCDVCRTFGASRGDDWLVLCPSCRAELIDSVMSDADPIQRPAATYCEACGTYLPTSVLSVVGDEIVCAECAA